MDNLPRLLYIGDVPVEASYHGSVLLYRLLEDYPAERLGIMEAGLEPSRSERRLNGVQYWRSLMPGRRLLNTRFHRCVSSFFSLVAEARPLGCGGAIAAFRPEAVLTVAHGYSWMTAGRVARRLGVPLHFIVHDDWPRAVSATPYVMRLIEQRFAACYRQAASRLCVSHPMQESYRVRYGVKGTVLLPCRAKGVVSKRDLPARSDPDGRGLIVGFGGNVNSAGCARALRQIADALLQQGGRLHIYGPTNATDAAALGLTMSNVEFCGLVPSSLFTERMREEVDVLVVPISFAPEDKANMSLCFPSKLTEYTAAGLPILIYGPSYCSAVGWAMDKPGVAVVVAQEGVEVLVEAVRRLKSVALRMELAGRAGRVGDAQFSHAVGFGTLCAELVSSRS